MFPDTPLIVITTFQAISNAFSSQRRVRSHAMNDGVRLDELEVIVCHSDTMQLKLFTVYEWYGIMYWEAGGRQYILQKWQVYIRYLAMSAVSAPTPVHCIASPMNSTFFVYNFLNMYHQHILRSLLKENLLLKIFKIQVIRRNLCNIL